MELLFATTNPHKVEELGAVLAAQGFSIVGLSGVERQLPEPEEHQPTFMGNAELKALYYARETNKVCLADDSGLVVDALGGEPGVRSARYAGVGGDRAARDAANNEKLLDALSGVEGDARGARFVCALCCASPGGGIVATAEGFLEGRIGEAARGENGFGYDPLVVLEDGRTAGELSAAEKNLVSHRARAGLVIAPKLRAEFRGRG